MTKLIGCVLILSSAVSLLQKQFRARHTLLHIVEALQGDLTRISTAIRWQQTTLPEAIIACQQGRYTGKLFQRVAELLQRDIPLQIAWTDVFHDLDAPLRDVLCAMSLQGDREHLLRQFDYARSSLQRLAHTMRAEETEKRKLSCGAVLSGAAILMILLL